MFADLCADTACYLHFVTAKEEVSLCLSDTTFLLSLSEAVVQTNQYQRPNAKLEGWFRVMTSLKNRHLKNARQEKSGKHNKTMQITGA